jgi:mannose-6-phosphate isomerase-like protein (cupin superfamily)
MPPLDLRVEDAEPITARKGRDVVILVADDDLTITWSRFAAGERGADLHVHREHTDAFFILHGELTFGIGPDDEQVTVPAGGFVAVPPNVQHSFANESDGEARWLNLHAPDAGFAAYMRGVRDGRPVGFDSFDPPPAGGLPSDRVILRGAEDELDAELPGHRVTTRDAADASHRFVHERGVLAILR